MKFHDLPVYQHRNEIIAGLQQNQILIVESPTGSGKTTQLPIILHEAGYTQSGMIGITQPRRIATLSVCDFISQQLQVPVREFVGYKMRFEDETSSATKIKIMTDGTLLQELKNDPLLLRYSVLMVDEAHERSLTIDFILGLIKDILPQRPDLRLLISSATIRTEIFSRYFFDAPVISISTESFPVQVIYHPLKTKAAKDKKTAQTAPRKADRKTLKPRSPLEEQAEQIRDLILRLDEGFIKKSEKSEVTKSAQKNIGADSDEPAESNNQAERNDKTERNNQAEKSSEADNRSGDVLVFLPGEGNIKACLAALLPFEKQYGLYTLPLYARLGKEEQQRIFEAAPFSEQRNGPCRKIILATNIAETSLTIEGIAVVVDTGLAKLSHFDSSTQHAELRESGISKASAEQRKGRAGRVAPGICYRLYSRSEFQAMRPFTQEEIQRTDLTEVVLRMAELGIRKFESFDFLSKPKTEETLNAIDSLVQLGALQERQLTEIGKQMCNFPLLPKHSRILVEAVHIGCIHPACVITAFLSCSSPFLLPHGEEREAREAHSRFMGQYGDFEFYLKIFQHYCDAKEKEIFCQKYYLDSRAMHELQRVSEQLKEIICATFGEIPISEAMPEGARQHEEYTRACLAGLHSGLCLQEGGSKKTDRRRRVMYRSLNARNIIIHPGSSLFQKQAKYIVAGEIMRTSQTYARCAAILEPAWIDRFDPQLRKLLDGHGSSSEPSLRSSTNSKGAPNVQSAQSAQNIKGTKNAASPEISKAAKPSKNSKQTKETKQPKAAAKEISTEAYLAQCIAQASSKTSAWKLEGQHLLWLGQRFELLNYQKLLRSAQNEQRKAHGQSPNQSKHQSKRPIKHKSKIHLVPHIKASYEVLAQSAEALPDTPPELGIRLQFQERLVCEGLMLSDLYQIFSWHELGWAYWGQELSALRKLQGKLRPSYDASARMKSRALLSHFDLLFTPVLTPVLDAEGIYGLDSDATSKFWFRPFLHFGEMLQSTSLALEALAQYLEREGKAKRALPDKLQTWLERCDRLF